MSEYTHRAAQDTMHCRADREMNRETYLDAMMILCRIRCIDKSHATHGGGKHRDSSDRAGCDSHFLSIGVINSCSCYSFCFMSLLSCLLELAFV